MADGVWVVSRCLLGEACRYDGAAKPCAAVQAFLAQQRGAVVVGVCPECDCGLPCPRPTLNVVAGEDGARLICADGSDQTARMRDWSREFLAQLTSREVRGFILKSRSPSCGLGNVPVQGEALPGDGLFAGMARAQFPTVPLLTEWALPGGAEALSPETLLKRISRVARMLLAGGEACHDWDHTMRVRANALELMSLLPADTAYDALVVEVATLLHDVGRPAEVQSGGDIDHALYGSELVESWLRAVGVTDADFCQRVARCVRCHRFRSRAPEQCPQTLEEQLVYDADKLDSIGAIGIGRAFHFAGGLGARVHNGAEEALAGASYGREDSAYREYLVKLRHVRERMLTQPGRQLAERRHRFMETFFAELNHECGLDE